ncbi:MAG: HD domain-containing protein [Cyclobacteriaceae bacterium]
MMRERLQKQMAFLIEAGKIKNIFRMNYISDGSRLENDAEHSWHLCLLAIILSEHAKYKELDILKVLKMLLIHDIVEIDAGDAYVYDASAKAAQYAKEVKAAERLFNILPIDQAREYRDLWDEFEERKTPEAQFAAALDRLHPMLMNFQSQGKSWLENNITAEQVQEKNQHMQDGSPVLWEYATDEIIAKARELGFLG